MEPDLSKSPSLVSSSEKMSGKVEQLHKTRQHFVCGAKPDTALLCSAKTNTTTPGKLDRDVGNGRLQKKKTAKRMTSCKKGGGVEFESFFLAFLKE